MIPAHNRKCCNDREPTKAPEQKINKWKITWLKWSLTIQKSILI